MTNPNGLDPDSQRQLYNIQRQAFSDALRENRRREAIGDAVGQLTRLLFIPIFMIGMGMYLTYCTMDNSRNTMMQGILKGRLTEHCHQVYERMEKPLNKTKEEFIAFCEKRLTEEYEL